MLIYPAIDLRHGQCVRLYQGDFNQTTVYDADPLAVAQSFSEAGATLLHVVDLDAAKDPNECQLEVIANLCKESSLKLQVGGGIRTLDDATDILTAGADKISVNSPALEDPSFISRLADRFGQQCVVVGIDSLMQDEDYIVYQYTGDESKTQATGRYTLDWVQEIAERGAGEIVLNCMDQDGVRQGYDVT